MAGQMASYSGEAEAGIRFLTSVRYYVVFVLTQSKGIIHLKLLSLTCTATFNTPTTLVQTKIHYSHSYTSYKLLCIRVAY